MFADDGPYVYLWYCMQNPCLVLTDPVRAVKAYGLVIFEASLYVKGATSSLFCSVGWYVSLLVREEVLLAGLCERKILFR